MIEKAQVEKILDRLHSVERELADPAVASQHKRYRELMLEHSSLRKLEERAVRYFKLVESVEEARKIIGTPDMDDDFRELAEAELAEAEEALPRAERDLAAALLPTDPDAQRNAMIEIRAGTGGDEAAIFAGDLYRMYCRYSEEQGWRVTPLDASPGGMGGYKEIVFLVEGTGSYAALRYEGGGHRVQRVPETESQGRVHTSAATVAVFPQAEEDDELVIDPQDLRIDTYRSGGAGGQHVNKTESAIRITHLPTGTVVECQDERSQHKNRDRAMKILASRLYEEEERKKNAALAAERKSQVGTGDRSERIRTYNFPQGRVTDHRIGLTLYKIEQIMNGDLDELIDAIVTFDQTERMKASAED